MFIPLSYLVEKYSLKTTGVLHIGAHGFVRKEIHIIEGGWGDAFYVRDTLTLSNQ